MVGILDSYKYKELVALTSLILKLSEGGYFVVLGEIIILWILASLTRTEALVEGWVLVTLLWLLLWFLLDFLVVLLLVHLVVNLFFLVELLVVNLCQLLLFRIIQQEFLLRFAYNLKNVITELRLLVLTKALVGTPLMAQETKAVENCWVSRLSVCICLTVSGRDDGRLET